MTCVCFFSVYENYFVVYVYMQELVSEKPTRGMLVKSPLYGDVSEKPMMGMIYLFSAGTLTPLESQKYLLRAHLPLYPNDSQQQIIPFGGRRLGRVASSSHLINKLNEVTKEYKKGVPSVFKELSDDTFELGHHYSEVIDFIREAMHNMNYIVTPCFKHVDNNHKPLSVQQSESLKTLAPIVSSYINSLVNQISDANFKKSDKTIEECMDIADKVVKIRKKQLKLIKKEPGSTRTNMLFLDMLNETKNLLMNLNNMYKAFRDFSEHNEKNGMKSVLS